MSDREKVMSWLEGLAQTDWHKFHSDTEVQVIAESALALLKEQEATKPEEAFMPFFKAARLFHCGNCHEMIVENQKYCHECGKRIEWEGR